MTTSSTIYWLTRCDGIREFLRVEFTFILILLIAFTLVSWIVTFILGNFAGNGHYEMFDGIDDDEFKRIKGLLLKVARVCSRLCVCSIVLKAIVGLSLSLIPTTKEMCAIIVIPKIANSESVQEIGSGIVDLAREWLNEIRPSNVNTVENKTTKEN